MIVWLDTDSGNLAFPPVEKALKTPSGLLAAGGDLSPERLLHAYQSGIFPWFEEGQPILWWSPDPRAVIFPDRFRMSHSLAKAIRNKGYSVSFDQAFERVITECAASVEGREHTWITADMNKAYCRLHALQHAHSVEVWDESGELIGGLYGLAIGKVFFGESMFSRQTNASKIALAALAAQLQRWDYALIDCQLPSEHLGRLGAETLDRADFISLLRLHCANASPTQRWEADPNILKITLHK